MSFKCNLYLGLLGEILEHFPYNQGASYSINWFLVAIVAQPRGKVQCSTNWLSVQGELCGSVWFSIAEKVNKESEEYPSPTWNKAWVPQEKGYMTVSSEARQWLSAYPQHG